MLQSEGAFLAPSHCNLFFFKARGFSCLSTPGNVAIRGSISFLLPFVDSNPQQRIRDPLLRIRTGALPARPRWPRGMRKGLEGVFPEHLFNREREYVNVYLCVYVWERERMYVCVGVVVCMYVFLYVCVYDCMSVSVCVSCVGVCPRVCMCACAYSSACSSLCACVCVRIYLYNMYVYVCVGM